MWKGVCVKKIAIYGKGGIGKSTTTSNLSAALAAREAGAQAALFGHTHQSLAEQRDGLWLINPGTCGPTVHPTCAVLNLDRSGLRCRIQSIYDWSEEP